MLRKVLLLFCAACLTAMVFPNAGAQSITSGDGTGAVVDPSGAGVSNAEVTLTNVGTNATLTSTTTPQGTFRFAFVPPGVYNVTVKAQNF